MDGTTFNGKIRRDGYVIITWKGQGRPVKIRAVSANNHMKAFEVRVGRRSLSYPYAKLAQPPSSDDPVAAVLPDPEAGNEAFTYRLESGIEDTVHVDAVLEYNQDPGYLNALLVHQLRVEVRKAIAESTLAKRELCRRLATSPSQLYRLLDHRRSATSAGQLLAILHLLGREVEFVVREKRVTSVR